MTPSRAFNKLALILIINLFAQMHTADAGNVAQEVKNKVKKNLLTICDNLDSVPETICDKMIGFFDTKMKDEISEIGHSFCNSSTSRYIETYLAMAGGPLFSLFVDHHMKSLERTCKLGTLSLNLALDNESKFLKKECTTELKDLLSIRKRKKVVKCANIPTSLKNACSTIVTKGCEVFGEAEPELYLLIPFCEKELTKLVCEDLLSASGEVIGEVVKSTKTKDYDWEPYETHQRSMWAI